MASSMAPCPDRSSTDSSTQGEWCRPSTSERSKTTRWVGSWIGPRHPQSFRSSQRTDLGAEFDIPRTLVALGGGYLGHLVDEVHPLRISPEIVDECEHVVRRSSEPHRCVRSSWRSGSRRRARQLPGHAPGRSAVRNARASNGLCADSRPSRSSASSKFGVHAPHRHRQARRRTATTGASTDGSGSESSTSSVQRSCSPVASTALGAEPLGSNTSRRVRRTEQVKIGIAPVVEGPPAGHHHRVGVPATQHPARAGIIVGKHIEPEHEILGEHPVRDRCLIGASGASAQAFHHRRD